MKNEFDNRLIDKGWRSMRKALDREMPEKRRRRPLVWWWMGAVLLLSLGGAGGWQLYRSCQPAQTPAVPVQKPATREPVVESGSSRKQQEFTTSKPAERTDRGIAAAGPAYSRTEANATTALPENNDPEPVNAKASGSGDPSADGSLWVSNDVVTTQALLEAAPPVTITKGALLSLMPGRSIALRSEKTNLPAITPIGLNSTVTSKKHRSPAPWSFGLASGINTERFSSINGFSAGLVADWKPFRKWGLRTGIQYAQYQPSVKTRPVVSLGNSEYVEATGNFAVLQDVVVSADTTASSQELTSVLVPVDRLHRLEMPLMAFWQPVRFLRLYGGMTTSYNLSAKASEQNYANNKVYLADSQEAQSNLNELTASTLPRWHIDLAFGAGFRIGKRLELNAFYQPYLGKSGKDTATDLNGSFNGNNPSYQFVWQSVSTNATSRFSLNGILFF